MKTGAKRVLWICGLIMPKRQRVHKNDYSKRARDSVAPDSSCVACVSVGVVSSYSRLNWHAAAAAAAAAVCVWSHCPPRALPWLHDGLVAYLWSMPCWLWLLMYGCVAWPAYKPTPKALSLKFSQKLSAYTWVYTVLHISSWSLTALSIWRVKLYL